MRTLILCGAMLLISGCASNEGSVLHSVRADVVSASRFLVLDDQGRQVGEMGSEVLGNRTGFLFTSPDYSSSFLLLLGKNQTTSGEVAGVVARAESKDGVSALSTSSLGVEALFAYADRQRVEASVKSDGIVISLHVNHDDSNGDDKTEEEDNETAEAKPTDTWTLRFDRATGRIQIMDGLGREVWSAESIRKP